MKDERGVEDRVLSPTLCGKQFRSSTSQIFGLLGGLFGNIFSQYLTSSYWPTDFRSRCKTTTRTKKTGSHTKRHTENVERCWICSPHQPSVATASTSAPDSRRYPVMTVKPIDADRCSAVLLKKSLFFTLPPASTYSRIPSKSPACGNRCRLGAVAIR